MLIQLQDGKPIGGAVLESNFKQLFPGTSFPQFLTPEDVEPFGFGVYEFTPQPNHGKYEKIVEIEPVKDSQGVYHQTWSVVAMSEAEQVAVDERKSQAVRAERNAKLTATDWTQVADAPVDKAAWATYRQALRDISAQPGFPWNVTWPDDPFKKSAN